MNYLGIDYGEAYVGLAVAQGPLAQPLTSMETKKALQIIKESIKKYSINGLIIGNAPNEFLKMLNPLGLEIIQVDETLSSRDARAMVSHKPKMQRKMAEHSAAAAIILQNFLDSRP